MQEVASKIMHHVYHDIMHMTVEHPVTYKIREKTHHIDVICGQVMGNIYDELYGY